MDASTLRLKIYSLRDLEHRLGSNRHKLRELARTAGAYYRPFVKRDSKGRIIDNPILGLKVVQARIQERLLSTLHLPDHMQGGVPGRSPVTNASMHVAAKVMVTVDIRKFFPSVTNQHVFHVWRNVLDCGREVAGLLTQLTTFERHLPQGAPTSTTLANLVLSEADKKIKHLCDDKGVIYTRFVDDLILSGDRARSVINDVVKILKRTGFKAPHAKLKVMGPRKRHQITGLIVEKKLTVPPEKKARIRAAVHHLKFHQNPDKALVSIKGKIGFVKQVNPRSAESLQRQLEETISGQS